MVQRQWRRESNTEPLSKLTIIHQRDKFEVYGIMCDMHKGQKGQLHTVTSD